MPPSAPNPGQAPKPFLPSRNYLCTTNELRQYLAFARLSTEGNTDELVTRLFRHQQGLVPLDEPVRVYYGRLRYQNLERRATSFYMTQLDVLRRYVDNVLSAILERDDSLHTVKKLQMIVREVKQPSFGQDFLVAVAMELDYPGVPWPQRGERRTVHGFEMVYPRILDALHDFTSKEAAGDFSHWEGLPYSEEIRLRDHSALHVVIYNAPAIPDRYMPDSQAERQPQNSAPTNTEAVSTPAPVAPAGASGPRNPNPPPGLSVPQNQAAATPPVQPAAAPAAAATGLPAPPADAPAPVALQGNAQNSAVVALHGNAQNSAADAPQGIAQNRAVNESAIDDAAMDESAIDESVIDESAELLPRPAKRQRMDRPGDASGLSFVTFLAAYGYDESRLIIRCEHSSVNLSFPVQIFADKSPVIKKLLDDKLEQGSWEDLLVVPIQSLSVHRITPMLQFLQTGKAVFKKPGEDETALTVLSRMIAFARLVHEWEVVGGHEFCRDEISAYLRDEPAAFDSWPLGASRLAKNCHEKPCVIYEFLLRFSANRCMAGKGFNKERQTLPGFETLVAQVDIDILPTITIGEGGSRSWTDNVIGHTFSV